MVKEIQTILNVKADGIIGPNTIKAIANKLNCNNTIKDIQSKIGVKTDGIIGPKTLEAILVKIKCNITIKSDNSSYDIILDPGHTSDMTREYPRQFSKVDWTKGKEKEIADKIGFTKDSKDSIEHMLNVKLANATEKYLKLANTSVFNFDSPSLSNNSEISAVYRKVQELKPKLFLSIHNNAAGSSGWTSLSCKASGTVSGYKAGRENCKQFAKAIADGLIKLRKEKNGPHNRAESLTTLSVGVLNNCPSNIPATLVEVGFYDNLEDLYWMATHIDDIGKCMANTIINFLEK